MRRVTGVLAIVFLSLVTPGCGASGQTPSPPEGGRHTGAKGSGTATTGNPCDRKLVSLPDLAGIMASDAVKTEALEGDPQSCVFSNALGGTITVTVRPGLGDVTVAAWEKGQMNVPATPVAGVGDRAVWQDTMNEVIATKNNVLCDISVMGAPGTAAPGAQKRLGDLCNVIFSRQ